MKRANPFSLLQLIDQKRLKQIADKWEIDKGVRSFSNWKMVSVLVISSLFRLKSLRCIEDSLGVKRSTISDALIRRPCGFFEDLCGIVIDELCKESGEVHYSKHIKDLISLDSTECRVHSSLLKLRGWRKSKTTCALIKLHVMFNVGREWVDSFLITQSCKSDVSTSKLMKFKADACYVFDRAYCDLNLWIKIATANAYFVSRLKKYPRLAAIKKSALFYIPNDQMGVVHDGIFVPSGRTCEKVKVDRKKYKFRHIIYRDDKTKKEFDFITSDFNSSAQEIADIYKKRWAVELLFKWLKGHLDIRYLPMKSPNALRITLCVAVLIRLLLCLKKLREKPKESLSTLLRKVRSSLFNEDRFLKAFQDLYTLKSSTTGDLIQVNSS